MASKVIIGVLLLNFNANALDLFSNRDLFILGCLSFNIYSAWAGNDTNTSVLTNEFVVASTWVGNAYGIIDIIGWLLDWVAGYIFFAKSDTSEVVALKQRLRTLEKNQHSVHHEKLKVASEVMDLIYVFLKNRKHEGAAYRRSAQQEVLELLIFLENSLDAEIIASELPAGT